MLQTSRCVSIFFLNIISQILKIMKWHLKFQENQLILLISLINEVLKTWINWEIKKQVSQ